MKKFTQWVDVIREAEEKQQSELQKSYKDYFSAKLNKFGAKSPADLDAEQKAEFFNEIKKDWEKGTGAKPAGKKDVEEHGVKESVNEANQEEQIKKETISKLSDFFGCAPGNLSKFKFDGNDNIKELGKALRSTSDAGTEQYYKIAIQMAKRDLGINESVVNEAKKQITIEFTKSNQHEVSTYVFSRLENDNLVDTGNNGPDYMDLTFDAKNYDKVIDALRRCDAIDHIRESEEFELNEAVSTPEELASFITKEEKHFATFLKPKKLTATVNGKIVTIKPGSGSFTITVDFAKSTIDTTGKPEWPESTSYVELMEYIKKTKFKLSESEEVNEGRFNNYGWYLRLPKNVINTELKSATKNLQNYYDTASKGNDLQQDVLEEIINELENVKKQLKAFNKGQKPTGVYEGIESSEVNEGKKEDLSKQLEVIFAQIKSMNLEKSAELAFTKTGLAFGFLDMLSKPGAIKNLQDKSPEAKQRIKDAHSALTGANSSDEIKSILVGLIDSVNESAIFEADIKNAADFKEYATTVLKKQHGDKFDEKVADKVIKGLSDEAEKSGDWGAAVGKLNA